MTLTIVIPVYNEEKNIKRTVENIEIYMSGKDIQHDVVIVDDGSVDNTVSVVNGIASKYPSVSFLKLGKNCGKGKAVRTGMLNSKGDYVLFMDADGSTSIEEFEKFIPAVKRSDDVIIGTRKVQEAEIIEHQPFLREFLGKGFTALSNFITQAHVSDFTCGFKCFSKKAVKDVFSRAIIDDWSFDAEILHIARKFRYKITEVPVRWKNNRASKVKILRDILNSSKGLFRVWFHSVKGMYE